jgi:alkylation response protein AidB-like acyl-CoA dehydrogenase
VEFRLSEDQLTLKKWVHGFAEKEIRPTAPQYDESEEFPWPVVKKAAELGLYSTEFFQSVAEDPTGLNLPIALEETAWGCAGICLALFGTGLPLTALAFQGTQEQLVRWAPEMIGTAEEPAVGAFAVTEPDAGSDVSALATTARRDGDEWVLNGRKVFITNGGIAAVHIVVATVDATLGHRGQAAFIVPSVAGIRQGKKERKLGIRASHTAEVILEDCRIPLENVLGGMERLEAKLERARSQEGTRSSHALRTFEMTRPLAAAQALGIARAALEFAVDYAKERRQFERPIIQNLGGYGYIKDFPVEKWYRDAKIYTIFEGTSEIQRLVISRALARD